MDSEYMNNLLEEKREERRQKEAKHKLEEAEKIVTLADQATGWLKEIGIEVTNEQAMVLGKHILHASMLMAVEMLLGGITKSEERKASGRF